MNSLNSSSVDVAERTVIVRADKKGEVRTDVSRIGRASISTLATGVAFGLTD